MNKAVSKACSFFCYYPFSSHTVETEQRKPPYEHKIRRCNHVMSAISKTYSNEFYARHLVKKAVMTLH